jgi:hypothetical protein
MTCPSVPVSKIFFADDCTLLAFSLSLPDLVDHVNVESKNVCTYFRQNKLALHPEKMQFMLFTDSRDAIESNITIFINNNNCVPENSDFCTPLERLSSQSSILAVKFLGFYFDCDLNFKYHIRTICLKISRALYMHRSCKKFLSPTAQKTLYFSLIHFHQVYVGKSAGEGSENGDRAKSSIIRGQVC